MGDGFDREDELDRHLDDFWEGVIAGIDTPSDRALASGFAAMVHLLHARDDAPPPSSSFVRRLREELMERSMAAEPAPVGEDSRLPLAPNGIHPAQWRPRLARQDETHRWVAVAELAATAALVLALIGGAFGQGDRLRALWRNEETAHSGDGSAAMYRGDAARTGVASDPGPEGEPGLRWRHEYTAATGYDMGSPVVDGHTIYLVNGMEGTVTALDATVDPGGSEAKWSTSVGRIDASNPAVANGLVYVATAGPERGGGDAGYLIALDAEMGTERWRYETGGTAAASPAVVDETVYVVAVDGTLRAVDALTGKERWRFALAPGGGPTPTPYPTASPPFGTPAAATGASYLNNDDGSLISPVSPAVADGVVYAASNTGLIYAVDAATGHERWRFQTDGRLLFTPAVDGSNGEVTVVVTATAADEPIPHPHDGWVYAIDGKTGKQRWVWRTGRDVHTTPAIANGVAYVSGVGEGGRSLVALSIETGDVIWTETVSDQALASSPVVAAETIYVEDVNGRAFALDLADGTQRWYVDTGTAFEGGVDGSSPGVVDGMLILSTADPASQSWALIAIGSVQPAPGTPAATPLANGDASGLPPCTIAPRDPATYHPTGTPAASVVPVSDDDKYGQPAQILASQIPTGNPASAEAIAGIRETLETMLACARPGYEDRVLALYSDDLLRRVWVAVREQHDPGLLWLPEGRQILAFEDARELPDGRVGIVIRINKNFGRYVVFVHQGDRWLIDELAEIVPQLGGKG